MCRAAGEEEDQRARQEYENGDVVRREQGGLRVAIASQQVLGPSSKGGDLDIVAIPYVFRYLCAELASMGIAISLEVQ